MANHYQPSAVLKDRAKGFLNGKYAGAIGITAVYIVLYFVASNILSDISTGVVYLFVKMGAVSFAASVLNYVIGIVLSGAATVIVSVLMLGMSYYYLVLGSGQFPRLSDLFYGFRENAGRNIAASFMINIPLILSLMPGILAGRLYMDTKERNYALAAVILGTAGLVLYFFFDISLKMTYFIIADFPEYTASEAVKAGWRKMSGHRMRLFGLMLSFIPYFILGVLSFGIGLLWVYPLVQESYAQFYLDLMRPKKVSDEWERTV